MKAWSNYCKELKIASRGFYFYMEILMALILLITLLVIVPKEAKYSMKEVLYLDMPKEKHEQFIDYNLEEGRFVEAEDFSIKLKPTNITYYDDKSGEKFEKEYKDKKTITLKAYDYIDSENKDRTKTIYLAESFDDMIRISYAKKYIGSKMYYGKDGLDYYQSILFGSETDRYKNIVSSAHSGVDVDQLVEKTENHKVRYLDSVDVLNNRQNYIPLVVVMMNGLMGMMVIIAYISVDKAEGIIKAMSVSPVKISGYLMSKIMVVLTTSLISTLVIAIPIMGTQPNYPLFILTAIVLTILSCTIGLVASSYFKDLKGAFGVLIILMLFLMLPVLSYLVPSFSPSWMNALPSYYMLEAIKETLLVNTDVGFVLLANLGMIIISVILFMFAGRRYKKSLGI